VQLPELRQSGNIRRLHGNTKQTYTGNLQLSPCFTALSYATNNIQVMVAHRAMPATTASLASVLLQSTVQTPT
jgi:hypothetical protein